jgi:plasmid maintenance system antidote protein VapI
VNKEEVKEMVRIPSQRAPTHPGEMLTALRLAKFFGVSADFWMNMQLRWDLCFALQEEQGTLDSINRYVATHS